MYLYDGPSNTLTWLNDAAAAPGTATGVVTGAQIPDPYTDMYNDPCCDSSTGVMYLSDGSVDGLGFVASWGCVDNTIPAPVGEPCDGGRTYVDGGDIFQPEYDNNQDCTWTLTCSDPSLAPQITFTDFHTEGSWDFVYVYDGADVSDHIAVTLHGNLGADVEQITGSTSTVLLRLVTDGSVLAPGFTGSYTCEDAVPAGPPDPCTGDPVILTDGGEFFHSTLSADQQCRWQLVCSDNTLSPRITWTAFDLENAFDHVYLKEDGNALVWLNDANAPASATVTLTGTEIPEPWTDMYNNDCCDSSTAVLYLSDGSVDGQGFVGSFECVDNTIPYEPPVPPAPTGPSLRPMGTTAAPIGCYENFAWADTTDPEQVVPPANVFLFGSTDGCVCLLASSLPLCPLLLSTGSFSNLLRTCAGLTGRRGRPHARV